MKKVLVLLLLLVSPGRADADPVIDWNETALSAAFAANLDNLTFGCNDALHESRMMAMMHVAIHDALNAIDRRYQPYAFDGACPRRVTRRCCCGRCARRAGRNLPATAGRDRPHSRRSHQSGRSGLRQRACRDPGWVGQIGGHSYRPGCGGGDRGTESARQRGAPFIVDSYVPGSNPGDFQFIPGFGPVVAAPYWGQVTPFVLRSSSQYQPKAPYDGQQQEVRGGFQ